MRPHGRARTDATHPQAHAICDQCGFTYNLVDLRWNMDWRGPQIRNLRVLVCPSCQDQPQPNGQRTFILPADPVPIGNARPEFYVPDDQPLSAVDVSANFQQPTYGNRIGTMIYGGGINAAFDGNPKKPSFLSAQMFTPMSSYQNYVGINWTGNQSVPSFSSSLGYPVLTHSLSSVTVVAPQDVAIGSTSILVQGSSVGGGFANWTTLVTLTPTGAVGETLSGTSTASTLYQYHRAALYGGTGQISVASVSFSVNEVSSQ